jgi:uncharacterized protein YecE (DUF72 family)
MTAPYVGIAGWAIRREHADSFDGGDSHLERYATRFNAVEINSSFYRPHKPATYARWAASVPEQFRFAVKMPRTITHNKRLRGVDGELARFADEASALAKKLGPILIQLPPSLVFDAAVARDFFATCRERFSGLLACEPRHVSWFGAAADKMLAGFRIARVAADPAGVPQAAVPGGWSGLAYYRLHGSPRMYYSAYEPAFLERLARDLAERSRMASVWCILDNTALGAATGDALETLRFLAGKTRIGARRIPA